MSARLRSDRGSAMFIAIIVTLLMLGMVLGSFTLVSGQQRASGQERVRDSGYNLADSALESATSYMNIADAFPASSAESFGDSTNGACGSVVPSGVRCPDPAMVISAFAAHTDYASPPQWTVSVRDNNQPTDEFYTEDANLPATQRTGYNPSTGALLNYDFNADGKVWVRAEGTAVGKRRVVVALAEQRVTTSPDPYPQTGIYAEDFTLPATSRLYVDMQGTQTNAGRLDLSCSQYSMPSQGSGTCPQANATRGQILPWTVSTSQNANLCTYETGGPIGNTAAGPFCWSEDSGQTVVDLRARAVAAGKYFNGTCPTAAQLSGPIVFIDGTQSCSYASGSNTWNSPSDPGMIVLGRFAYGGTNCNLAPGGVCFNIGGDNTYYGMIYDGNTVPRNIGQWGVGITGNAQMFGVIISEAWSKVAVTSSKVPGFTYDPNAYKHFDGDAGTTPTGTEVKITPGSFHELPLR